MFWDLAESASKACRAVMSDVVSGAGTKEGGHSASSVESLGEGRKRGWRSAVSDRSASQARQRSTVSDRIGLASEAALHGLRPHRPRKRGSAPRVPRRSTDFRSYSI